MTTDAHVSFRRAVCVNECVAVRGRISILHELCHVHNQRHTHTSVVDVWAHSQEGMLAGVCMSECLLCNMASQVQRPRGGGARSCWRLVCGSGLAGTHLRYSGCQTRVTEATTLFCASVTRISRYSQAMGSSQGKLRLI